MLTVTPRVPTYVFIQRRLKRSFFVLSGVETCDKFIYPILDWEGNPGLAIGMIFGGCLVLPVIHSFWLGLAKVRGKIFERKFPSERDPTSDGRRHQTTQI
jgi:hypothetical protein